MSLARGANYSQAGIHTTLNDQFDVRDSVRIAGATAGAWQPVYDGSGADEAIERQPRESGVPAVYAAIFLILLSMILSMVYIPRKIQENKLNGIVDQLRIDIEQAQRDIADLDAQLAVKVDATRIKYEAEVNMMVPKEQAETISFDAPDPRPYERKTVLTAAGL